MSLSNSFISDTNLVNSRQSYNRDVKQDEITLNKVHHITNKHRKTKNRQERLHDETLDRIETIKANIRQVNTKYDAEKTLIEEKYRNKIDSLKSKIEEYESVRDNLIAKATLERDQHLQWWNLQLQSKVKKHNREIKHLDIDKEFHEGELERTTSKVKTKKYKTLVLQEASAIAESDSDSDTLSTSIASSVTSKSRNKIIVLEPEKPKEPWEIQEAEHAKFREANGGVPCSYFEVKEKWPALWAHWKEEEKADEEERKKNPRKVELDEEELKYQAQLQETERIKKCRVKQFQVIDNLLEQIKSERDSKFDREEDNSKSPEYNTFCDRIKELNLRKAKGQSNPKLDIF